MYRFISQCVSARGTVIQVAELFSLSEIKISHSSTAQRGARLTVIRAPIFVRLESKWNRNRANFLARCGDHVCRCKLTAAPIGHASRRHRLIYSNSHFDVQEPNKRKRMVEIKTPDLTNRSSDAFFPSKISSSLRLEYPVYGLLVVLIINGNRGFYTFSVVLKYE